MRELSKVTDKETMGQFKVLKRMITYVYEKRHFGIIIRPKMIENWLIEVFADSNFCGDRGQQEYQKDCNWLYYPHKWSCSEMEIKIAA